MAACSLRVLCGTGHAVGICLFLTVLGGRRAHTGANSMSQYDYFMHTFSERHL